MGCKNRNVDHRRRERVCTDSRLRGPYGDIQRRGRKLAVSSCVHAAETSCTLFMSFARCHHASGTSHYTRTSVQHRSAHSATQVQPQATLSPASPFIAHDGSSRSRSAVRIRIGRVVMKVCKISPNNSLIVAQVGRCGNGLASLLDPQSSGSIPNYECRRITSHWRIDRFGIALEAPTDVVARKIYDFWAGTHVRRCRAAGWRARSDSPRTANLVVL